MVHAEFLQLQNLKSSYGGKVLVFNFRATVTRFRLCPYRQIKNIPMEKPNSNKIPTATLEKTTRNWRNINEKFNCYTVQNW